MIGQDLQYAAAVARTLHDERARLEIALTRLYAASGSFGAVVAVTNNCLQRLAGQVRDAGGDIGGWVG